MTKCTRCDRWHFGPCDPGNVIGPICATPDIQDDIAALLRALGISDHARPVSPQAVVRDEILPAIVAQRLTLAAQAEEIVVLRRALIAHRADLHNGSKRPCPTCYQSAHALGIADKVPNSCAYAETDRTALATPLPARPA